jgi:hypothetical protein
MIEILIVVVLLGALGIAAYRMLRMFGFNLLLQDVHPGEPTPPHRREKKRPRGGAIGEG